MSVNALVMHLFTSEILINGNISCQSTCDLSALNQSLNIKWQKIAFYLKMSKMCYFIFSSKTTFFGQDSKYLGFFEVILSDFSSILGFFESSFK